MQEQPASIETHRLSAEGTFPNNPALPLLVYRAAFPGKGDRAAEDLERILESNGWGGTWRNGVYPYHHYHSNAHEVLAVCAGDARLQFGGPSGPVLAASAGDVVILPAGTAHKQVEASPKFLVVGGYPAGQEEYDLIRGDAEKKAEAERRIAALPLPDCDPLYGPAGPLREYWAVG